MTAITEGLAIAVPGLTVVGQSYAAVGVNDTVRGARDHALDLAHRWRQRTTDESDHCNV